MQINRSLSFCLILIACAGLGLQLERPALAQFFQPPATTVQQPTFGVSIDPQGVLTTPKFAEAGDPLFQVRARAAQAALPGDVFAASPLRKISLPRLNRAIQELHDQGKPPDEIMRNLAGLNRLNYVFITPEHGDVVLAGPAEGWMEDASGRIVGVKSGQPTILLEDLVVALRIFAPNQPQDAWVGCTINPTNDANARLSAFNRSIPSVVPDAARRSVARNMITGMRNALGMADIKVFSVSPRTHLAQIMIEADYRMKLMAVGLEFPPIRMMTFFGALAAPPSSPIQRWWFTPDYQALKLSSDRLSLELVGESVVLLTEAYSSQPNGRLIHTGRKPSAAARNFARSFTSRYPQIARLSPVFQQLRNMIDLLVIAAYFQSEHTTLSAGGEPCVFYDRAYDLVPVLDEPKQVPCVANAGWKGKRLIAVAGGGVSIQASQALLPDNLVPNGGPELQQARQATLQNWEPEAWWWD